MSLNQKDGEYMERKYFIEIYWSLDSLAHFMTFTIILFLKALKIFNYTFADGFGVNFEMGKKCYSMRALYRYSISRVLSLQLPICKMNYTYPAS